MVALALRAGVDLDMSSDQYRLHLAEACSAVSCAAAEIDAAVGRCCARKGEARGRARGGRSRVGVAGGGRSELRRLSVEIARRSDVLLENARSSCR